jgi:hypothetical protein
MRKEERQKERKKYEERGDAGTPFHLSSVAGGLKGE